VIDREKFEELCESIWTRCEIPLEKVLEDAHIGPEEVDVCLLVGSSTRIPKIRTWLAEFFESDGVGKINWEINPEEAVATGAALMAGMLTP